MQPVQHETVPLGTPFSFYASLLIELSDGRSLQWEWEVDKIDDVKIDRRGVTKFLVYWVGYPRPEWKPLEELPNCKESIKDYYDRMSDEIPSLVQSFLDEEG